MTTSATNNRKPARVSGTRERVLTHYPHIIPYRVKDNMIQILCVFYTHRRFTVKIVNDKTYLQS
ncbi:Death on curing protein, Doc toxin [Pectobacterium sp. F1-1]|nr:Death on curing protein, Doc toxin [Pectobacterium sp. F1-1]